MIAGYHVGGLLYHDPAVAVRELARMGFTAVAIRPHAAYLNPQSPDFGNQTARLSDAIAETSLHCVLDLDSPYLPDPRSLRGPSLVSDDPQASSAARQWIVDWIGTSQKLGARLITFSSGWRQGGERTSDETMLDRLSVQLRNLCSQAGDRGVRIALHPRCGDVIASVAQFERLGQWLDDADLLLAADIGEMLSAGEFPLADRLARNLDQLACVYLCDRRSGVGGDQRFGHGEVALGRILQSLKHHLYQGYVIARVEGHAELGFTPAHEAIQILRDR